MEILTIVFGVATLLLGILSYNLDAQKTTREKLLETFRGFAKSLTMIEYHFIDVIMLGPRGSGKTSIAELWTSPWTQISQIAASTDWRKYERDIHEFQTETRMNPVLEIEQTYRPTLRLRIHDYPGEDMYRTRSIKDLSSLGKKAALVFILEVAYVNGKIECFIENATYFSVQFTETVLQQLQSVSGSVSRAIIVFNKADVLPDNWSDTRKLEELKKANRDALNQIERLFSGNLEYHLTSAATNQGLIRLLGSVGLAGIESESEQSLFKKRIEQLELEFGLRKP